MPDRSSGSRQRLVALCDLVDHYVGGEGSIAVIGPSTTDSLKSLDLPKHTTVYSPWVTGSADAESDYGSVRSFICPDRCWPTCVAKNFSCAEGGDRGDAVGLERDSAYARQWRENLRHAWRCNGSAGDRELAEIATNENQGSAVGSLVAFYSRRIDGERESSRSRKNDRARTGEILEPPDGPGTLDYLRRLRKQLVSGSELSKIRAVGIFGIDVHDKLLILQAWSRSCRKRCTSLAIWTLTTHPKSCLILAT